MRRYATMPILDAALSLPGEDIARYWSVDCARCRAAIARAQPSPGERHALPRLQVPADEGLDTNERDGERQETPLTDLREVSTDQRPAAPPGAQEQAGVAAQPSPRIEPAEYSDEWLLQRARKAQATIDSLPPDLRATFYAASATLPALPTTPTEGLSHDVLVERSVGAMAIAEGDEGWEAVPLDCPMLVAVAALRRAYDALRATTPTEGPAQPWRCFHCDEAFSDAEQARLHFGDSERQRPSCQVSPEELRELEAELARYREEDTDLHRALHRKDSDHQQALMREEEKGYARGLRDGMDESKVRASALTVPTGGVK